jgi:hypothetical protein
MEVEDMSSKSSVQLENNIVVYNVLTDSKGRVPEGNIPLSDEVDAPSLLGAKYDATAEEATDKTMASFTFYFLSKINSKQQQIR